jgi:hypothetical protein
MMGLHQKRIVKPKADSSYSKYTSKEMTLAAKSAQIYIINVALMRSIFYTVY